MSKKFRVKRLKFNWLTAIALVLVAVTISAVLVNISDGFDKDLADWSFREVNEENLYQTLTFNAEDADGIHANGEMGIYIERLEDNELKVEGTADETMSVAIGTITLKAGQSYVFDSSLSNGSAGSVYMSVKSGETALASSYRDAVVFTVPSGDGDVTVTIYLHIAKDCDVNKTLKPILCIGTETDDAVKFYK